MLPAHWRHVSRLTYTGHWQKFTWPGNLAWRRRSRSLWTYQQWWEWGIALNSWEGFLLKVCIYTLFVLGGKKRDSKKKANSFFFFFNWAWPIFCSQNVSHLNASDARWLCLFQLLQRDGGCLSSKTPVFDILEMSQLFISVQMEGVCAAPGSFLVYLYQKEWIWNGQRLTVAEE